MFKFLIINFFLCFSLMAQKPNVVVIFADDLGYGDLGCFGSKLNKTPSLNKMAEEGLRLTDFHVASPVCSPSRAALMTGRYPYRIGVAKGVFFPTSQDGMPSSEITIAEILKQQGYATALVGKWHLGHKKEFFPLNQGFDYYYGIPYSNDMGLAAELVMADDVNLRNGLTKEFVLKQQQNKGKISGLAPLMRNDKIIEFPCDQTTLTKRLTEESVRFIEKNKDQPFFLYLAHSMPHIPIFASPDFKDKSTNGLYGDVIEELDWSVGQVMETLKKNGLDEKTLVIFTSDNGPWLIQKANGGVAGILRNGKGSTYEGGMRVPCIIKYPALIKPGQVSSTFTSSMDVLPTVAELVGSKVEHKVDGYSMLDLFKSADAKTKYDYFLHISTNGKPSAIRKGEWKLIFSDPHVGYSLKVEPKEFEGTELYNLDESQSEDRNLANEKPELVKELKDFAIKKLAEIENH